MRLRTRRMTQRAFRLLQGNGVYRSHVPLSSRSPLCAVSIIKISLQDVYRFGEGAKNTFDWGSWNATQLDILFGPNGCVKFTPIAFVEFYAFLKPNVDRRFTPTIYELRHRIPFTRGILGLVEFQNFHVRVASVNQLNVA